jgi:precorrin isomerase
MSDLPRALVTLATVHGIDLSKHVDAATGNGFDTLASFKARNDAIRASRRALKDGDTITADDFAIRADSYKDENRADARAMLKASVGMTRRERAMMTTLAAKGV